MSSRRSVEPPLEVVFAALADPTRLRLIGLLAHEDLCVCDLVDALHDLQPKISRHLAHLRRARLVVTERCGKWIRYSLRRPIPHGLDRIVSIVESAYGIAVCHAKQCCPPPESPPHEELKRISPIVPAPTSASTRAALRGRTIGRE